MEDLPAEESGSECGSTAGKPRVPRQAFWMDKPQSSRFPTNLHHVKKCTTTINTAINIITRNTQVKKGQRSLRAAFEGSEDTNIWDLSGEEISRQVPGRL